MKDNINDFTKKLFNMDFLLQTYRQFLEDPDIIEHSIIPEYCKFEGNLNEKTLLQFLKYCKKNKLATFLLPQILYYSNQETISVENFKIILTFPRKQRMTLLNVLAHCPIAIYQLEYINNRIESPEAYCQLLNIYCNHPFTVFDLENFLYNNKQGCRYLSIFLKGNPKIDCCAKKDLLTNCFHAIAPLEKIKF